MKRHVPKAQIWILVRLYLCGWVVLLTVLPIKESSEQNDRQRDHVFHSQQNTMCLVPLSEQTVAGAPQFAQTRLSIGRGLGATQLDMTLGDASTSADDTACFSENSKA